MTMPGHMTLRYGQNLILVIKQILFIVPIHSTFTSALKYFIIIPSFLNERVKQKGNNKIYILYTANSYAYTAIIKQLLRMYIVVFFRFLYTFMCIFFFLFVYIWRGNNKNNLERARK